MKKLIAICSLVLSSSVFAVGIGNDNPPSDGGTTTNTNTNQQGQAQGQLQGQAQGQLQGQAQNTSVNVQVKPVIDANARARAEAYAATQSSSTASTGASTATAGGSTSSITSGDTTVTINHPERQRVYNVPSVGLGAVYPTAPCMGSSSIGGSGVGFGFGIGTSWTDDECGIRETARSFNGLGLKDDAVSVLCASKYASVAKACQKEETQK